jgi:hypothetical protein
VRSFRYLGDPLCLVACIGYAANRWLVPAEMKGAFFSGYFADLLLIPAALPIVLWLHRRLGLRRDDRVPTVAEVGLHLALWGCVAEFVGPHVFAWTVADPRDLLAYAAGAVLATGYWHCA